MTDRPEDLVRDACGRLAGYLPVLEWLLAEPATPAGAGTTGYAAAARVAETPEPWFGPAGRALMDAHEGVRRLEAALRYAVAGHPGRRRGGSAGNTAAALDAIPKLAAGLDRDAEAAAARIIERWIGEAMAVPAIDEARRWRSLGRTRRCPRCGCYQLHAALDDRGHLSGVVECFTWDCRDPAGYRPAASMGTDDCGRPVLTWADGTIESGIEEIGGDAL